MTACPAQHSLLVGEGIRELARQLLQDRVVPELPALAAGDSHISVSHLMNSTIFHDEMAGLADERKAVDIYPDFSKVFDIASHKIPVGEIMEVCAG
ncbi:hypothetical protein DUI87_20308 [Hirundo rustica rustica]|uniref:Uncharacterized protein n=1 Tax=Hirundo rustica rustica TaxID=333673 RepID=A0A3M0JQW8_HIRRU|nr:hypothetical protein DUI87_20308 [Hirundo rustica rustica]